jgi:hypothetical protein
MTTERTALMRRGSVTTKCGWDVGVLTADEVMMTLQVMMLHYGEGRRKQQEEVEKKRKGNGALLTAMAATRAPSMRTMRMTCMVQWEKKNMGRRGKRIYGREKQMRAAMVTTREKTPTMMTTTVECGGGGEKRL